MKSVVGAGEPSDQQASRAEAGLAQGRVPGPEGGHGGTDGAGRVDGGEAVEQVAEDDLVLQAVSPGRVERPGVGEQGDGQGAAAAAWGAAPPRDRVDRPDPPPVHPAAATKVPTSHQDAQRPATTRRGKRFPPGSTRGASGTYR